MDEEEIGVTEVVAIDNNAAMRQQDEDTNQEITSYLALLLGQILA